MPEYIEGFFELAPVSSSDVVYDLGCGDGRLLFAALEKGAGRCVGIDIDPRVINRAREWAAHTGVEDKVTFIEGDLMDHDFSDATVILLYLFPEVLNALQSKFENELRPGTRIVSEVFSFKNWKENENELRPGTRIVSEVFSFKNWKENVIKEIHGKIFNLFIMPPEKEENRLA
jgi:ribosomal protein L11 methylase PrmA